LKDRFIAICNLTMMGDIKAELKDSTTEWNKSNKFWVEVRQLKPPHNQLITTLKVRDHFRL